MKHFIHVLRFPDGRFLDQGFDCADRFVQDPLNATPMTLYERESDTNEYQKDGAVLIQFEITATPTGITCADIFKSERMQIAQHKEEQRAAKEQLRHQQKAKESDDMRIVAKTLGIDPLSWE